MDKLTADLKREMPYADQYDENNNVISKEVVFIMYQKLIGRTVRVEKEIYNLKHVEVVEKSIYLYLDLIPEQEKNIHETEESK